MLFESLRGPLVPPDNLTVALLDESDLRGPGKSRSENLRIKLTKLLELSANTPNQTVILNLVLGYEQFPETDSKLSNAMNGRKTFFLEPADGLDPSLRTPEGFFNAANAVIKIPQDNLVRNRIAKTFESQFLNGKLPLADIINKEANLPEKRDLVLRYERPQRSNHEYLPYEYQTLMVFNPLSAKEFEAKVPQTEYTYIAFWSSYGDPYPLPFSYDVSNQAVILANLLGTQWVKRSSRAMEDVAIFVFAFLAWVLAFFIYAFLLSPWVLAAALLVPPLIAYMAFLQGYLVPALFFLTPGVMIAFTIRGIWNELPGKSYDSINGKDVRKSPLARYLKLIEA